MHSWLDKFWLPIKTGSEGDPSPSLLVPKTVTIMAGEERQAEIFVFVDVCSQVWFRHDTAWIFAEEQMELEVGTV